MARYKCPKPGCPFESETKTYCNRHRTSVKCIDTKSGKGEGGLFGNLNNVPDTTPPNSLKGLKYK